MNRSDFLTGSRAFTWLCPRPPPGTFLPHKRLPLTAQTMRYLIDGYNLLHAMGMIHGRAGPQGLEKARLRLLGLLHGTFGDQTSTVTVVFDAAGAPPGAKDQHDFQGIHVHFAVHQKEADELIEDLIRHDAAPRQLTVVS